MTTNIDLMAEAHSRAVRQPIRETARQLVAHLGPTAVSFLAGAKDTKRASRWSTDGGPEPSPSAKRRLLAAHRAWTAISSAENDYVARNWFIGANPRLGERSPLEVLREGDDAAVLAAAAAFADGTDG